MFPVYGGECKWFTTGLRKSLKDIQKSHDAWPGCPVEIATDATVQQVEELIRAERRIMIDSVATALGCAHGLAYSIMCERLKFRKECPENWGIEKKNDPNRSVLAVSLTEYWWRRRYA
jgi:hypothetical protein